MANLILIALAALSAIVGVSATDKKENLPKVRHVDA